jgi:hypothetical protein
MEYIPPSVTEYGDVNEMTGASGHGWDLDITLYTSGHHIEDIDVEWGDHDPS